MCDLKIVFTIFIVLAAAVATSVRNKRQDYVALGSPLLLPLQYLNHLQIQPITRDNVLAYNLLQHNPNNLYVNGIHYQNSPAWNLLPTSNAHNVEYITQYSDNLNTNQDEGYHTIISNQGLPIEPNPYNSYTGLNDYSTIISNLQQIEALKEETKKGHHHLQEDNREGETRSATRDNLNTLSNNANSVSNNFSHERSNLINSDGFVRTRGQETADQTSKSGVQRNISNDYSTKSKFLIEEYPQESFSEQNKFLSVLGNLGNNFLRGRSNRETLPIARNELNNKGSSHQKQASGSSNSEATS